VESLMRDAHDVTDRRFVVLLGGDGAGKSSVMAEMAARRPGWRMVSTDEEFVAAEHGVISQLRRATVEQVLPELGTVYSADFLASLLQTAVVYLRDQIRTQDGPVLMDSYYYKLLAKCRLAGVRAGPMYAWWRSFAQPQEVIYLDVSPESAWRRSHNGTRLNTLEYFGSTPEWCEFESYQRSLRKLMFEEIRHLPVRMIDERPSVAATAEAVLEVLAR
jgi:thymidylate kinase